MGLSLDQIFASPHSMRVGVTIVSNEDDGLASYASGTMEFIKGAPIDIRTGAHGKPDRLTTVSNGVEMMLSDRVAILNPPAAGPQRFNAKAAERLAIEIHPGAPGGGGKAKIGLNVVAWSNKKFIFDALAMSDMLVGVGPTLSNKSANAVYAVSFQTVDQAPA
jgi:hypothetical protein